MINAETSSTSKKSILFNRVFYGFFLLLTLYFILANRDYGTAASNIAIALIFDPFDQNVPWQDRPIYQRIWLLVHVAVVVGLFGFVALNYFLN